MRSSVFRKAKQEQQHVESRGAERDEEEEGCAAATIQQSHLDELLDDKKAKKSHIGLSRNASPSSVQPSFDQGRHYVMKPLSTLDEDPLDLTIVQEDSQT